MFAAAAVMAVANARYSLPLGPPMAGTMIRSAWMVPVSLASTFFTSVPHLALADWFGQAV